MGLCMHWLLIASIQLETLRKNRCCIARIKVIEDANLASNVDGCYTDVDPHDTMRSLHC